ncbi:MAG: AfsR/SARP family transcriptional regulator [Omnitrophica WOR_2 bacterium]
MARLELCLLGPLVAVLDGKPITTFESNKVRALLAYLAAEANQPQRREKLAELLWPDWSQQSALNNLRSALVYLRTNIGDRQAQPPFLLISRDSLQFNRNSDCRMDVSEFERLLAGANRSEIIQTESSLSNLQSAVDLYRGPFLEGFSLPDSTAFEEWRRVAREQYQRQMLQALSLLADYHEQMGRYKQALQYSYRQLEIEPWLEEAHQQLMRLLALIGRRSEALAQYEACRQTLKDELDIEPGFETTRLYEYIREGKLESLTADRRISPVSLSPSTPSSGAGVPPRAVHNLPQPVTRFFGREHEIAAIKERLEVERLLTLTGAPGVGKTRLALRIAEQSLADFKDGVWFTDLSPLADPELVARQVAARLGLHENPGRPVLEILAAFLNERQILLVLDNCEHLLAACARLADSLLQACPILKILASSREPLGVEGEAVFYVPSLPFPQPGQPVSLESLRDYASIRLFIDRARLILPSYQVTAQSASALAAICQHLDGIPLAIELAAARMGLLTTEQLAGRLKDVFRLLTGGSRTALPRHQTLRATLDWSYKLLDDKECQLLQRLAVFAGGWDLAAAEGVCAGEGIEEGEILDLLASLVNKSLVVADRAPGSPARYRMLETIRQYAREKLRDAGESVRQHTRHRDYFLVFAETNKGQLWLKDRSDWFRKFEAEHENFRLALEWSMTDLTDVEAGIRLILALDHFWVYSHYQEAADWFEKGLVLCQGHPDISLPLYALFLGVGAYRMAFNSPQTAYVWGKQAVEVSRRLGPDGVVRLVKSLLCLAWIIMWDLDDVKEALAPFAEAEALFQELDPDQYPEELYWSTKGELVFYKSEILNKQGQYEDAKTYARESIRIQEQLGRTNIIWELIFLGEAHVNLGEYDQARARYLEALQLADEIVDNRKPLVLRNLGMVDFLQGNLVRALEYCREGLRLAAEIPDNNVIATCLGLSACILAKQGRRSQSAGLSGAARDVYERQGRKPSEDSTLDTLLPGWRESTDSDAIMKAYEAGRTMTVEQAISLALSDKV